MAKAIVGAISVGPVKAFNDAHLVDAIAQDFVLCYTLELAEAASREVKVERTEKTLKGIGHFRTQLSTSEPHRCNVCLVKKPGNIINHLGREVL